MEKETEKIEKMLIEEAKKINPSKRIFSETLKKIDLEDVTKKTNGSYIYQTNQNKGRLTNKIFMKLNWNIVMPVVIIIAVAVVLIVGQPANEKAKVADNNTEAGYPELVLPKANGNVDETVDAILATADNELSFLLAESSDLDLVDSEIQSLNDFGNAYDIQGI